MNNLDKQYTDLLQDILKNGTRKGDRTGTGTISVFGRQIRHNMKDGFPLLTTKKMPFKTIVTELLWFLRGDTNIKFLVDNNCHIWDGDAYKNYCKNVSNEIVNVGDTFIDTKRNLISTCKRKEIGTSKKVPILICEYEGCYIEEDCKKILSQEAFINKIKTDDEFANKWGELGPIYGKQWRSWETITKKWWDDPEYQGYGADTRSGWEYEETQIDQIANLINYLKTNPDSRRLMVNAWNVGELDQVVLPPCHYGFQVYTRELSYPERYRIADEKGYLKYMETNGIISNLYLKDENKETNIKDWDNKNIPTRAISLMWNQRSVDTFLGLPFNIASYGLLLEMIAKEVNMVPEELIGNLGDVHLYSNHIEQAKEQIGRELTFDEKVEYARSLYGKEEWWNINDKRVITVLQGKKQTREPYPLPTFDCPALDEIPHTTFDELVFKLQPADFYMDDYQSHPTIKAPLSN